MDNQEHHISGKLLWSFIIFTQGNRIQLTAVLTQDSATFTNI